MESIVDNIKNAIPHYIMDNRTIKGYIYVDSNYKYDQNIKKWLDDDIYGKQYNLNISEKYEKYND